ncbi:MAG: hypothetical protein ABSB78_12450 [Bacteroidota bacterium]
MKWLFLLLCVMLVGGKCAAQMPSVFWHTEVSSGLIMGRNIKPSPFIPMLRFGSLISLDRTNEHIYLGVHLGSYWGNPGVGFLGDVSVQWYVTTVGQHYASLFIYPETGYSIVVSPDNGGSFFGGGGISLSTSFLVLTVRGMYLFRQECGMGQLGAGIRF